MLCLSSSWLTPCPLNTITPVGNVCSWRGRPACTMWCELGKRFDYKHFLRIKTNKCSPLQEPWPLTRDHQGLSIQVLLPCSPVFNTINNWWIFITYLVFYQLWRHTFCFNWMTTKTIIYISYDISFYRRIVIGKHTNIKTYPDKGICEGHHTSSLLHLDIFVIQFFNKLVDSGHEIVTKKTGGYWSI